MCCLIASSAAAGHALEVLGIVLEQGVEVGALGEIHRLAEVAEPLDGALAGLVLSDATAPLAVTVVNRAIPPPQPVPSLPAWPLVSLLLAGWAARAAGRPPSGARRG